MKLIYAIVLTALCLLMIAILPEGAIEPSRFALIMFTLLIIRYEIYENNKNN